MKQDASSVLPEPITAFEVFGLDSIALRKLWGDVAFDASERAWARGERGRSIEKMEADYRAVCDEWRASGELKRRFDAYRDEARREQESE